MPQIPVSAKVRGGAACNGAEQIEASEWFQHWERGGVLLEETRQLDRLDQTLTLLWFEDEEIPPPKRRERETAANRKRTRNCCLNWTAFCGGREKGVAGDRRIESYPVLKVGSDWDG